MTRNNSNSGMPSHEKYPRKTLRELSKSDADNTYFVSDEEHEAIDFDAYSKAFVRTYRRQLREQSVAETSKDATPFSHVPSTLDGLVPPSDRTIKKRYVFLEFKNRAIFRRNGSERLQLKESIQSDITYKLYDTAILMHVIGRACLPTGYAQMDAYVVCSAAKNSEYASTAESSEQQKRFRAFQSLSGPNDELMDSLDETEISAFKPKATRHLTGYLYRSICFITELQLQSVMEMLEED